MVRLVSGFSVVAQHIPLFKIGVPLVDEMVPPPVADIPVMSVTELASTSITSSAVSFFEHERMEKKANKEKMTRNRLREFMMK